MSWGRFSFTPQQGPTCTRRTRVFPAHKPAPCDVVVIDEDDDGDVVILEGAATGESTSAAAAPGSQARKGSGSSDNVIHIDDDEDEKDGTRGDKAGPSVSRASGSPAARTPGRGSPRNIYGLGSMSDSYESDLSEDSDTDDGSDCEILDDTTGTAREMWQTASSRKKPPHGVHECKDARATAFASCSGLESASCSGLETPPGKNSEHLFGAKCHRDESMAWFASKYDSQNTSGRTKEGPGHAQSSADNAKGVCCPSVPHAKGVQNNTSRSKECSMVGSEKASVGVQSTHTDGNFASANRVFSGILSADRKGRSPPISVSTPEKVDEKVPEDVYSQKDQSPPEPSDNTNIYSAQGNGSVRGKDLLQDPENLGGFASVKGEREKHKESLEYKRAAEEEWASRQRQLQIQAEEAKKLRKRKKAEAQRLLDMEERQKQRLQEVRESQRKNEEAIQIKEEYRGVVRKELEGLESRHWDMTSILHELGISIEGGEVKAFKQALLKFHPDRVSRNDIYQQVRAEETFKFITRLKEKLPRP